MNRLCMYVKKSLPLCYMSLFSDSISFCGNVRLYTLRFSLPKISRCERDSSEFYDAIFDDRSELIATVKTFEHYQLFC